MTKNHVSVQSGALRSSRIDELLHAIALAMARRQMEKAWPSFHKHEAAIA